MTLGARYEITVGGKPRSNRDTKTVAIEAGECDLVGGETIVIKKPAG